MNTRQKLTLGIVAVFMVTLTIVGVTYAYFVTRVEGLNDDNNDVVDVSTAKLASVQYGDGNATITLDKVLPGEADAVAYKTFTVTNESQDASSLYDVVLTATDNTTAFIHTSDTTKCYTDDAINTKDASCYQEGVAYNNIEYALYETTTDLTDETDIATAIKDLTPVNPTSGTAKVMHGTKATAPQILLDDIVIGATETKNYVLMVKYVDAGANQNIENNAGITVKVDIR